MLQDDQKHSKSDVLCNVVCLTLPDALNRSKSDMLKCLEFLDALNTILNALGALGYSDSLWFILFESKLENNLYIFPLACLE